MDHRANNMDYKRTWIITKKDDNKPDNTITALIKILFKQTNFERIIKGSILGSGF